MSPTGDHPLPGPMAANTAIATETGNDTAADVSDEQLVQRCCAGELTAFDLLYSRYELPVWRYALRIVHVPSMADAMLKDVWFSVLRQFADASSVPAQAHAEWRFKPWLFGLVHSRVVETVRSAKRPIDPQGDFEQPESAASERNAGRLSMKLTTNSSRASRASREVAGFRQLRSLAEAKTLLAAVEHLPLAQRYAFLMHAEGRLRADEVARVTAVSFETAINRVRFAREALRLSLANSL